MRRAQECVELCLKAVLRLYGVEYPKAHEVSAALVRIRDRLPPWFAERLDLVVEASVSLASQRAPSFYGDELRRIPAGRLFGRREAEDALNYARELLSMVKKLMAEWSGSP